MNLTPRMMDAKAYSEWAHKGQVRKYTNEPYANHPARVADIVRSVGCPEDGVIAAYLHDTVEDTSVTLMDIQRRFGYNVCGMVYELTTEKRPGENRAARKQRETDRLSKAGYVVATIKLADLLDNTNDIVRFDLDFARQYMKEKAELLAVLQHGHQELLMQATQQVRQYLERLDESQRQDALRNDQR